LHIRIAINAGEIRFRRGDIFGEPVNIAARIESLTPAGEIWFSEAVYLGMTKSEVPAEEVGSKYLKGVQDPIKIYRIPPNGQYLLKGKKLTGQGKINQTEAKHSAVKLYPYGGLGLERVKEKGVSTFLVNIQEGFSGAFKQISKQFMRIPLGNPAFSGSLFLLLLVASIFPLAMTKEENPFTPIEHAMDAGLFEQAMVLIGQSPERNTSTGKVLEARLLLNKKTPEIIIAAQLLHQALELKPELIRQKKFQMLMVRILNRKDASKTVDLLAAGSSPELVNILALASQNKNYWLRWNSIEALKKMQAGSQVDLGLAYILDLKHEKSCAIRKKAVLKLADIGESRALIPLKEAKKRAFFQNICMGNSLTDAINKLDKINKK
jgi:hypothetical protein